MAGDSPLPGVELVEPRRFRPRFHYELLVCGVSGHELIGIDARELRDEDRLVAGPLAGAFSLQSNRLTLVGAVFAAYALVEGVEAVGLWFQRRWAEYLTFLVTASLLP